MFTHAPAQWKRALPFEDHLELSKAFAKELEVAPPYLGHYVLHLTDGSSVQFTSLAELESYFADLRPRDVNRVGINFMHVAEKPYLNFTSDTSAAPTTQLSLSGPDETLVRGLHAKFKTKVDRRFEDLDERAAPRLPGQPDGGINIGSIGSLGILAGGQATTTVTGPVAPSAPSPSGEKPPRRWWNHPWTIAIVAGTLAAVAGALLPRLIG